jgi:glycosyltransferase involved in cell wall biosynthesis
LHESGGLEIMLATLNFFNSRKDNFDTHVLLDPRFDVNLMKANYYVNNQKRHLFYNTNEIVYDFIFCMASVPPLQLKSPDTLVYIYFHNIFLINQFYLLKFFKLRMLFWFFLKKIYILKHNETEYIYVVQTETMSKQLNGMLRQNKIIVFPIFDNDRWDIRLKTAEYFADRDKCFDLIYISRGHKYKDHLTLFKAMRLLRKRCNFAIRLCTTISRTDDNFHNMGRMQKRGYDITNFEPDPNVNIIELINKSRYGYYGSYCESFGLPLLEYGKCGIDVIAIDRPYIKDVLNPSCTFEPGNYFQLSIILEDIFVKKVQQLNTVLVNKDIEYTFANLMKTKF